MQSLQDTDFYYFFFLKTHVGGRIDKIKNYAFYFENYNVSTNKITMYFFVEINVTSQHSRQLVATSEHTFTLGNIQKLFSKLVCETCTFSLQFCKIVYEQHLPYHQQCLLLYLSHIKHIYFTLNQFILLLFLFATTSKTSKLTAQGKDASTSL